MPPQTSILEQFAFRIELAPVPVLDYIGALALQAVSLGERIGIFKLLQQGPLNERLIAQELRADERGVRALLGALESVGYLRKRGEDYALSTMAAKWLPRLSNGMSFFNWMAFEGWPALEGAIQARDQATTSRLLSLNGAVPERRAGGASANSRLSADEVVKRVQIPASARKLLDIGAGYGQYSISFCEQHPRLTATLIDLEPILNEASKALQQDGIRERITMRPQDFWEGELGNGFDVTLLFNLLNAYPPDRKVDLLRRAATSLSKDGIMIILDQMRRPDLRGTAKAVVELTNLRLFDPEQHDTYSLSELAQWLRSANLRVVKTGALRSVPWMSFVVVRKTTSNGRSQHAA